MASDPIRSGGKNPFGDLTPRITGGTQRTTEKLQSAFADLHDYIIKNTLSNRERSIAITNLEQAFLWIEKAILVGEQPR